MSIFLKGSNYLVLVMFIMLSWIVQSDQIQSKVIPCIQYKNGQCIKCPQYCHLQNQQCYQNIQNCTQYQYGTATAMCKKTSTLAANQNLNSSSSSAVTIRTSSYFYTTTTSSSSQTLQSKTSTNTEFNGEIYIQMLKNQMNNDSYFQICNKYMKTGEYSHFISRSQDPVQSSFCYISNGLKQFKILYQGSGGNLLLCLISINIDTKKITLRSFVTIGRTRIIDKCIDYSLVMDCVRCSDGYHLDNTKNGDKICALNISGCVSYFGNICIRCRGAMFLIENKCISQCQLFRDSRSIRFYGNIFTEEQNRNAGVNAITRNYF